MPRASWLTMSIPQHNSIIYIASKAILGVEEVIQEEAEYLKAANDEEIMKWMGRWLESAERAEEDQGFVRDEAAGASLSS